jgi:hypothetical protein
MEATLRFPTFLHWIMPLTNSTKHNYGPRQPGTRWTDYLLDAGPIPHEVEDPLLVNNGCDPQGMSTPFSCPRIKIFNELTDPYTPSPSPSPSTLLHVHVPYRCGLNERETLLPAKTVLTFDVNDTPAEDFLSRVCATMDLDPKKANIGWKCGSDRPNTVPFRLANPFDVKYAFNVFRRRLNRPMKRGYSSADDIFMEIVDRV